MIKDFTYFVLTSFRRQMIDKELFKVKKAFKGKVLDVGGSRKRGLFEFPKEAQIKVVDVSKKSEPDIIASVEKLPFEAESFDVIKATELFEHVEQPELGVKECARVLKRGGYFILSMPFLYPIHADPFDFQRWTKHKLKMVLSKNNLQIKRFEVQGYYFSVLADFVKTPILKLPLFLRYFSYLFIIPFCFILLSLDKSIGKKNKVLNKYHQGYFVVCQKT